MEDLEVEIKNISLSMEGNTILKNVSFNIKKGEIHCIIGPNGGGKSSLIKTILGEVKFKGEIIFFKKNLKIGYVPQHINLNKDIPLTIEEFLAMNYQTKPCFLGISSKKKKVIDELLKEFNLYDKRKYIFTNLSGGERQKVLFIQGLIPLPELLILDEPLTGMDEQGKEFFVELVKKLKLKNITILWIEHDIYQVKHIADTVTCLNKKIIFSGSPRTELFDKKIKEIFI